MDEIPDSSGSLLAGKGRSSRRIRRLALVGASIRSLYASGGSPGTQRSAPARMTLSQGETSLGNRDSRGVPPVNLRRQSEATLAWYLWTGVLPYQRRLLEALSILIDRRLVWDPSG